MFGLMPTSPARSVCDLYSPKKFLNGGQMEVRMRQRTAVRYSLFIDPHNGFRSFDAASRRSRNVTLAQTRRRPSLSRPHSCLPSRLRCVSFVGAIFSGKARDVPLGVVVSRLDHASACECRHGCRLSRKYTRLKGKRGGWRRIYRI